VLELKTLSLGSVGCERAGNETVLIDAAEESFRGVCNAIVLDFEGYGDGPAESGRNREEE